LLATLLYHKTFLAFDTVEDFETPWKMFKFIQTCSLQF